jgi:hypothetical protein
MFVWEQKDHRIRHAVDVCIDIKGFIDLYTEEEIETMLKILTERIEALKK